MVGWLSIITPAFVEGYSRSWSNSDLTFSLNNKRKQHKKPLKEFKIVWVISNDDCASKDNGNGNCLEDYK